MGPENRCEMSTLAYRRNSDKSSKISWLGLCFRFRFAWLVVAVVVALCLIVFQPRFWLKHLSPPASGSFAAGGEAGAAQTGPNAESAEPLADFLFVMDETKWIASGRKTKRIHVVDKIDQV